jgi:predicted aldo/keto reductase-like oxidoreductase
MKRRAFVKTTAMSLPLMGMFPSGLSSMERVFLNGKLERRKLGKTGEKLSIIGFGGIVVKDASTAEAEERVSEAIRHGVNYFDVAPSYGNAEAMLGPALEPFRKDVFLACKTNRRTQDEAERELEKSLENLRTDHFDLYQLHAVAKLSDVDTIFSSNGALKTLLKAREDGRVRYLGFSAHSVEAAMELMNRFNFDTILFPINFATWHAGNFGPQVLERAREKEMGILALKAMAHRPWQEGAPRTINKVWYEPLTDPADAGLALRFTLSHPITAAIPPGHEDLFRLGLKLAMEFEPLTPEETVKIKHKGISAEPLFRYNG